MKDHALPELGAHVTGPIPRFASIFYCVLALILEVCCSAARPETVYP